MDKKEFIKTLNELYKEYLKQEDNGDHISGNLFYWFMEWIYKKDLTL